MAQKPGSHKYLRNPMENACPNLIFDGIDTTNNELVVTAEGWQFWSHEAPPWPDGRPGEVYNVQFCKLIGRKRDVFQCINETEWRACTHVRLSSLHREMEEKQQ